jgi:hypothetical protein
MRERQCRLIRHGEQIFARVVERAFGETTWRLVEEWDVSADLPRLVAEAEAGDVSPIPVPMNGATRED